MITVIYLVVIEKLILNLWVRLTREKCETILSHTWVDIKMILSASDTRLNKIITKRR